MKVLFFLTAILGCQTSAVWAQSILVDTKILRVRQEPKGKLIGRVYEGQQFIVLNEREGWGEIQFEVKQKGWISLDYTKPMMDIGTGVPIKPFCRKLNQEFDRLKWKAIRCNSDDWRAEMQSVQNSPLIYTVIGNKSPTSLLLCSVHSDENTPYQCFRLHKLLKKQPELLNHRVVIAPLVNPDGFLKTKKTRTNIRGIDLNRNLPTRNWRLSALKEWKQRYQSNKRRYPGRTANSEPENQFVVNLIQKFTPDKIISIHAPMNFLDLDYLDGTVRNSSQRTVFKKAKALALHFSKESHYKFRNYRTFTGSLGRYGDEWQIPIYTLELPSADYTKSERYFQGLQRSLFHSFNVNLDNLNTVQIQSPSKKIKIN
ncbi:MAG: hypothetical protein HQM13_20280 [SAR324 cluster bacterium]|nr:hypothetical protein [SAR324 cluster bacterium]